MFEWNVQSVRRVIAKMIAGKDLNASLDAPAQTLVIHEQKASYLQKMALLYADKVRMLAVLSVCDIYSSSNYQPAVHHRSHFGSSFCVYCEENGARHVLEALYRLRYLRFMM